MEDLRAEPGAAETLVSAQTPPWLLLGDVLLCTSTHPYFADWGPLQGHASSRYVQVIVRVLRPCLHSRKQLESSSWPVLPSLPKHKCSLHVKIWNKHLNVGSFRGLPATWLNNSSRHVRFYRGNSSQASIRFLPALQDPLFRR